MNAPRVQCPGCGQAVVWSTGNPWRPFCCERCKMADLGAWFLGERSIPGDAPDQLEGVPPDASPVGRQRDDA
jgi:uncharacterized protein